MNKYDSPRTLEKITDDDLVRGLSEPVKINLDSATIEYASNTGTRTGQRTAQNVTDDDLVRGLTEPAKINLDH